MAPRIKLNTGDKIEGTRLTYVEDVARINPKRRRARFKCECGSEVVTDLNWVRFGNVLSCGCLKKEMVSQKNMKHGHAVRGEFSGAYRSWMAMHQRHKTNSLYADRTICSRWCGEEGFENFLADMGDRPDGLTLERVDNDLGYSPENCVWADRKTQNRNKNSVPVYTWNGETKTLAEWSEITGIKARTLNARINTYGWSVGKALTTEVKNV